MNGDRPSWRRNPLGLYRDTKRAKISGVCAGLAAYFDVRVKVVRILTVVSVVFFHIPVLIGYGLLTILLKPMPDAEFQSPDEERFWRKMSASPNRSAADLTTRFGGLERRLADIEAAVVSNEFDLRRKFKDLSA